MLRFVDFELRRGRKNTGIFATRRACKTQTEKCSIAATFEEEKVENELASRGDHSLSIVQSCQEIVQCDFEFCDRDFFFLIAEFVALSYPVFATKKRLD